jgi:hypothetical protein
MIDIHRLAYILTSKRNELHLLPGWTQVPRKVKQFLQNYLHPWIYLVINNKNVNIKLSAHDTFLE